MPQRLPEDDLGMAYAGRLQDEALYALDLQVENAPQPGVMAAATPQAAPAPQPGATRQSPQALRPLSSPADTQQQRAFIDAEITRVGQKYGVDPRKIHAVVNQESRYNPQAVSPKGAQGLGQLMPATARQYGVKDPFDITQNLEGTAQLLADLQRRYPNDLDRQLAAYNAGPGAVERYDGVPPFRETQQYVQKVGSQIRLQVEIAPGGLRDQEARLTAAGPPAVPVQEEPVIGESPAERFYRQGALQTVEQMLGGTLEAAQQTVKALEEIADFVGVIPPEGKATRLSELIPQIAQSGEPIPDTVRSLAQFLTVFGPAALTLGAAGAPVLATGAIAGGMADYLAFDPQQPNVAKLINELAPSLQTAMTTFLATDPDDPEPLNRLRNVVEGAVLGGLVDVVTKPKAVIDAFVQTAETMRQASGGFLTPTEVGGFRPLLTSERGALGRRGPGFSPFAPRQQSPAAQPGTPATVDATQADVPLRYEATLPLENDELRALYERAVALADSVEERINVARRAPEGAPRRMAQVAEDSQKLREQGRMSLEMVKRLDPGTTLNDAEAHALMTLIGEVGTMTRRAAVAAMDEGSEAAKEQFFRAFTLLQELDPARFGVIAESGRSLRILGDPNIRINQFVDQYRRLLQDAPGFSEHELIARVASLHSLEDYDRYVLETGRQKSALEIATEEGALRPRARRRLEPAGEAPNPPPATTSVVATARRQERSQRQPPSGDRLDEIVAQTGAAALRDPKRDLTTVSRAGDDLGMGGPERSRPLRQEGMAFTDEELVIRAGDDTGAFLPATREGGDPRNLNQELRAIRRAGGEFGVGATERSPAPASPQFAYSQEELVVRAGDDTGDFAPVTREGRDPTRRVAGIERAGEDLGTAGIAERFDPLEEPILRAGDDMMTGPSIPRKAQMARGGHPAARGTIATAKLAASQGRHRRLGDVANILGDMLREAWINSRLASPWTHVRNNVGNTFVAVWSVPERYLAAPLRGASLAEANAYAYGMAEGVRDAFRLIADGTIERYETAQREGWRSVLRERRSAFERHAQALGIEPTAKIDAPVRRALTKERLAEAGLDPDALYVRMLDGLGEIIRLPGRTLGASDDFFKLVNYRAELRAQAVRMAMADGLSGTDQARRVADILTAPTTEAELAAHESAMKFALAQTFQTPLGKAATAAMMARDAIPGAWLIVPFMRTPVNIGSYMVQRSGPMALASRVFREDLAAGGERRARALANLGLGSAAMMTSMYLAAQGLISGRGPGNAGVKDALERQGWRPYSFLRIGQEPIPYNQYDPLGMLFGMGADIQNILAHSDQRTVLDDGTVVETAGVLLSAYFLALKDNFLSKTYMKNLADALEIVDPQYANSPEQYAQASSRALGKLIASSLTVPPLSQLEQQLDPVQREAFSVIDQLRARTPGFSDALPPRRNLWGKPILVQGGLRADMVASTYQSLDTKPTLADGEIARLNLDVRMPERSQSFAGVTEAQRLTVEEYDVLVQLAAGALPRDPAQGERRSEALQEAIDVFWDGMGALYQDTTLQEAIEDVMTSPEYTREDVPDLERGKTIQAVVHGYRKVAKEALLVAFPDQGQIGGKVNELRAVPPDAQQPSTGGTAGFLRQLGIRSQAERPLTEQEAPRGGRPVIGQ